MELKLWNSSTIKIFQNFSIELEFIKLEYYRKLPNFEYLKDSKSLHISEIVVNCSTYFKNSDKLIYFGKQW